MKKLSVKDLVEFRNKSDKAKKNFVESLKLDKEKTEVDGGGDYWITSLSAIANSYRSNDLKLINDKIDELEQKLEDTENDRAKVTYKRNIDILYSFENFDFKNWRPSKNLRFIRKHKPDTILKIKGLQVQAKPQHVFTFRKDNVTEIGAIWFIAKLKGYRKDELGMFADILYQYLKNSFSEAYEINPRYCIAVDVVENTAVNYSQIQKGEIQEIFRATIDEIKKLM